MSDNPFQMPETDSSNFSDDILCPKCGGACEVGTIQSLGTINWYPRLSSFKMSVPERISPKGYHLESKIPAVKCPACNFVMIQMPEK
ncbi:MAG: PF20097 family protein [Planctomycetota bacterium]